MSLRAQPVDLRHQYQFSVEVQGFETFLFSECDEPEEETETIEFNQAGTLHATRIPGRKKYGELVLRKGIRVDTPDRAAYDWSRQAGDPDAGTSEPASRIYRDVDILHLKPDGAVIERTTYKQAFVTKLKPGEKKGSSGEVQIEELTLAFQYPVRR